MIGMWASGRRLRFMIDLYCPGCGHHLRIQEKFIGKSGACKHCGTTFTVPEKGDIPTSTHVKVPEVADKMEKSEFSPGAGPPKETVYQADTPESTQHQGGARAPLQNTEFMPD